MTVSKGTAVVTGASSGIGKLYADRLAHRGYDLILVARSKPRLDELAAELGLKTGRKVEVLPADLTSAEDVRKVAERIRTDAAVTLLVNNAGSGTEGPVIGESAERIDAMVQLNVVALTNLAVAAFQAFSERGQGTLVNIASVVSLFPEHLTGAYSATKAFVLNFTLSLKNESGDGPVRIQAVLPGLTRTEFFDRSGMDIAHIPDEMIMTVEDLVDAALAGLDQGEVITIPSLPDASDWESLSAARLALYPNLSRSRPAARYGLAEAAAI